MWLPIVMAGLAVCLFGFMIGALVSETSTAERWRIEAVGHGYAHFNTDSSWHWNNEGASK